MLTNRHLYTYLFFFIILVSTFISASHFKRYQAVGDELLLNADFSQGLTSWNTAGPKDSVQLRPPDTAVLFSKELTSRIKLFQNIFNVKGASKLLVTGKYQVRDVVPGNPKNTWNRARIQISSHNEHGRWLPGAAVIFSVMGSSSWQNFSQIFSTDASCDQVKFALQLLHVTGTLHVKNLSIRQVAENPAYPYLQVISLSLMTMYLLWLLVPYIVACRNTSRTLLLLLIIGLILFGALQPKKISGILSLTSSDGIGQVQSKSTDVQKTIQDRKKVPAFLNQNSNWNYYITKAGHFFLFLCLALCLSLTPNKKNYTILFVDVACLAGTTELMQLFIEGRTPLPSDFLLDTSGGLVGILFALFIQYKRTKVR
ncbi:MAG: VanZ family protein [Desulfobulbaceae bacterium]|nr:VanZ family protein [Desulfobulbaceae bacterium]